MYIRDLLESLRIRELRYLMTLCFLKDEEQQFKVPICCQCGGILKPDIVFFGDNVPQWRVEAVKREVEKCDSLLVLGSSLTVFSSYRIILQLSEHKKQIAIVNIGPTRGDKYAHIKVDAKCGDVISKLNSSSSSSSSLL